MKGAITVLSIYAFLAWTGRKLLLLSCYYTAVALRKYVGPCVLMGDVLAQLHAFLVSAFDGGGLAPLCDRSALMQTFLGMTR